MRFSTSNLFGSFRWCLALLTPILLTLAVINAAPREGQSNQRPSENRGDWASGEGWHSEPAGTDLDVFTYVPLSPGLRFSEKTATFKVIYDAGVPQEVRTVFQSALDIWAVVIESPVPIEVEVKWTELTAGTKSKAIMLGQARPTAYRRDFPGAPRRDVWYPNALANRLAKKDLDPDKSDIVAVFNSKVPWYFATDGVTPRGKYDLLTVILHELGHGLGFASTMKVQDKEAGWGMKGKDSDHASPTIFDTFAKNQAGKQLIDTSVYPNPSATLLAELTSRKVYFAGRLATAANGGAAPPLHAPALFKSGASFAHLSESAFPPGHINSLLTPATFRAEAIHHPGPIAIGMLRDMGWGHIQDEPNLQKGDE